MDMQGRRFGTLDRLAGADLGARARPEGRSAHPASIAGGTRARAEAPTGHRPEID